jgi:hypothetical protein
VSGGCKGVWCPGTFHHATWQFPHSDNNAQSPAQLQCSTMPYNTACCIAVKSSVPQGMFVCIDKRGWLVCRNSSDTEGVGRVK